MVTVGYRSAGGVELLMLNPSPPSGGEDAGEGASPSANKSRN